MSTFHHLKTAAAKVGFALVKTQRGFMLHKAQQSIHTTELTTVRTVLAQLARSAA